MGLGIVRLSIVCAVADGTGDDSADAIVKIRRLVNQRGRSFCDLANWPFLRSDTSFDITASAYKYSGASYLPTTFKRITGAFLLDGTTRCPLDEVGIMEAHEWANPDDNTGRPDEFCITRMESGYWEIQFNKKPDNTYTVYLEMELQWSDLTSDTTETLITKDFYDGFALWCKIGRFQQQGDTENYNICQDEWYNPLKPKTSMFNILLGKLSNPLKKKSVIVSRERCGVDVRTIKGDYDK